MKLTEEQKIAAKASGDEIAIIARAGTGKTTVAAARIKEMVDAGVPPQSILAITFTRSGGQALQRKVQHSLGHAGTLHSLAMEVMRVDPTTCLTEAEETESYKNVLEFAGVKGVTIKDIRRAMISPKRQAGDLGLICKIINRGLEGLGKTTFDKVLLDYHNLLSLPSVKHKLRYHVIVDEAQDTSAIDAAIYRSLSDRGTLTAIGDPAQAIYGFRGASPLWLLDGISDRYYLTRSFRCPPKICTAANRLLHGTEKKMVAADDSLRGSAPSNVEFETERAEEDRLIEIANWVEDQPGGETLAILCRYNKTVERIRNSLQSAGVKVAPRSGGGRTGAPGDDDHAMVQFLRAIVARSAELLVEAHPEPERLLRKWPDINQLWKRVDSENEVGRIFSICMCPASWIDTIAAVHRTPEEAIEAIVIGDSNRVQAGTFVDTIHAAKGQEWDHVVLAGADETLDSNTDNDPENLVYVAATRARWSFMGTWARNVQTYGGGTKSTTSSRIMAYLTGSD